MYQISLTRSYIPAQSDGEVLETTVGSAFRAAVEMSATAVFLREAGKQGEGLRSWTYARAGEEVERLALSLSTRFAPGERIIAWAPNSPEWIWLQLAAALAGLVLVPANPAFRKAELRYVVEHSRATAIVVCETYRGVPLASIAAELCAEIPGLQGVFAIDKLDQLQTGGAAPHVLPLVRPDDATQIQYTSGTTGRPKGAVISNRAFTNNARLCFERLGISRGAKLLHFMPLFHTGGCGFLLLGAMQRGVTIVLANGFDPSVINSLVERERITVLLGVPTMIVGMLEDLDSRPRDLESLNLVLMGGSTISPQLVRRVTDTFGCRVAVLYGQTETSSNMTCTWPQDAPEDIARSVGQPLPNTEMSIRNPHSGEVLAIGEIGEICVRSYTRLMEYFDEAAATARAIDGDGWLHTGDLGSIDARGYLSITGRLKDMIIRGGENIYPAEIEALLARDPDVAEAVVFGIPDERWGEVVCCFVRPAADRSFDPGRLAEYCRHNLAPSKVPLHWRAVDRWPLTGSGKIQKFALRDEFVKQFRPQV
jgi:fatty-acyl-CoA synthase